MSRWIDADALINDLEYDISIDLDILNYVGTEGAERTNAQFDKDCKQNAIELLLRQPSINLVRCAECKHWRAYETWSECELWTDDPYETAKTKADDFCSYGERKESE